MLGRETGCGVVDREFGVLPTPDEVRRVGVLFVTLLLVSDIEDVKLVFESVAVLLRFVERDGVVLFRLLTSAFLLLLLVPRM